MIAVRCLILLPLITMSLSSQFTLKGDPCSKYDSCSSKTVLKTCSCERDCHDYGTCCHDSKLNQGTPRFQCYNRRILNPVFAKRSCSKVFRGHADDQLACIEDDEDEMDVQNNLLVTSRKTKITYWNKHCAKCNHEAASDLEFWNINVICPSHKDVDKSLIRKNLTFDQDKKLWGLMIEDKFRQCIVKYSLSLDMDINEMKYCTPNLISSCPDDYNYTTISSKCAQYYGERKLKNTDIHYKNIHCAICNGANLKELECKGMSSPDDSIEESDFRETVEEIFANGEWLEKEPGKQYECSKGYSYDPGREKCRKYEIKEEVMATTNTASYESKRVSFLYLLVLILMFL